MAKTRLWFLHQLKPELTTYHMHHHHIGRSRLVLVRDLTDLYNALCGATGKLHRIGLTETARRRAAPHGEASQQRTGGTDRRYLRLCAAAESPRQELPNLFLFGRNSLSGQRVVSSYERLISFDKSFAMLLESQPVLILAEQFDLLLDEAPVHLGAVQSCQSLRGRANFPGNMELNL